MASGKLKSIKTLEQNGMGLSISHAHPRVYLNYPQISYTIQHSVNVTQQWSYCIVQEIWQERRPVQSVQVESSSFIAC